MKEIRIGKYDIEQDYVEDSDFYYVLVTVDDGDGRICGHREFTLHYGYDEYGNLSGDIMADDLSDEEYDEVVEILEGEFDEVWRLGLGRKCNKERER